MKTKTIKTAAQAHEVVEAAAMKAAQRVEVVPSWDIGDVIQQGDIYVVRVPDETAPDTDGRETQDRKLAPGNNPGARHIIDPDADVTVYVGDARSQVSHEAHALFGPLVVARGPWTLMHPEHGHKVIPAGCAQVLYQVDAVTMQRVRD